MEETILKTPLYQKHVLHGGRMVPFAGYWLPVQYEGVVAEHMAVRTNVGLFDVSHMGEVRFAGPDALKNIQNLLCNDYANLAVGRVRYSPMLNERGGVVDDVLVYRLGQEEYLMVVNAANRHKDVRHILANAAGDVAVEDISDSLCQLALQGPRAEELLGGVTGPQCLPARYYSFVDGVDVGGVRCLVSRTGYTGEDGFELYAQAREGEKLFDVLVEAGRPFGMSLCGLGCRDTLRLEAAMPLYGHEMDDAVSPLETGLGAYVKMDKPAFIGREALAGAAPQRTRVGLRMVGRGIAREGFPVSLDGRGVGHVTSGTHCPFVGAPVAMALVETACAQPGQTLEVEVRGKPVEAQVVPLPFYSRK